MQRSVHVIGIGGIGVSGLARYYRSLGWQVTGSDAVHSDVLDELRRDGIRVSIGHRPSNIKRPELVVYSAAVQPKNLELRAARKKGIRTLAYAEALGGLTKQYYTIAISGSHGKSTTTALIGIILVRAGLDPTVIVGAKLREFAPRTGGSNFRKGKNEYLVIEADEWNRSFHHYFPRIAVLTNIDKEHLDTYKTYAGVVKGFARYVKNVLPDGTIVANANDKGVRVALQIAKSSAQGGSPPEADGPRAHASGGKKQRARTVWFNKRTPRYPLAIPGAHNQLNADAAWAAWRIIANNANISQHNAKRIANAVFRSYRGAWRRLEKLRVIGHTSLVAIVYSDYAHHPTEIKATLEALRERHPKARIVCVYEPHQEERLTRLFREFTAAFQGANKLVLLPMYRVLGREEKGGKTSLDLAHAMHGGDVFYAPSFAVAMNMLAVDLMDKNAVIVFMGAGTIDSYARHAFSVR